VRSLAPAVCPSLSSLVPSHIRSCLPQNVRRTLDELPESLDDTYERVVMEIKRANQSHAYRMLQCLTVAVRPLTVAELAELLAFDFDSAKGGIPKLHSDWRWKDHEQAVLSTCSSLVTLVPNYGSTIVQFSHFSVKEFLMSDRLATSARDISQYHISLEDSHTILAQACLAVLLWDPDMTNDADSMLLAGYAAEHWVTHAQVENVASRVRDGMEYLFDPTKPYFEAWVQFRDFDRDHGIHRSTDSEPGARPFYYAALCELPELVELLILKYPQYANAVGGRLGTALHSALFPSDHLQVVRSLLRHGVSVDVRDLHNRTPLTLASWWGERDAVQCLLEHGADVTLRDVFGNTPLTLAAFRGHVDILQVLLDHNADVNAQDRNGRTPLHDVIAGCSTGAFARGDYSQVARLLLEHGANANPRDHERQTPLHRVARNRSNAAVARVLLDHGADIDAEDEEGKTPLQVSLESGHDEIAQLLSGYHSM
jgi:ankyrin repeat protein